ncbi:Os09g0249100, partial [Oryza sativa Japonica Group]
DTNTNIKHSDKPHNYPTLRREARGHLHDGGRQGRSPVQELLSQRRSEEVDVAEAIVRRRVAAVHQQPSPAVHLPRRERAPSPRPRVVLARVVQPRPRARLRVQRERLGGEFAGAEVPQVARVHLAAEHHHVLPDPRGTEHAARGRLVAAAAAAGGLDRGPRARARVVAVHVVQLLAGEAVHHPHLPAGDGQPGASPRLARLARRRQRLPPPGGDVVGPQVVEAAGVAAPAEHVHLPAPRGVGHHGVVAPVRRAVAGAGGQQRPSVGRRVKRVELVQLLVLLVATAEHVDGGADGRHGDADARRRHVAGGVQRRPALRLEVEGVHGVVHRHARRELAAERVRRAADEGDGVGASCSRPISLLL